VEITRVLALTFLFNGMATQYRADLTRKMRFRALASVDIAWLVRLLGNPALSTADHWPVRSMLLNASMSLGLSITGGIFLASGRLMSAAVLNLCWGAAFLALTVALADHGNAGLQTARLVATVVLEVTATMVLLRCATEREASHRVPGIHREAQ